MLYGEACKMKMKKRIFVHSWLERFSSNLLCKLPQLAGSSVANLVPIRVGITELRRCEKCVFFLIIYSRCGTPASWAARHTTVCLD